MTHIDLPEKLIQHLWFDQALKREMLRTLDGRSVEVLFPGIWTLGITGPDFKNAVISIGNRTVKGDVEVHIYSSDWENHRHNTDPHYNNVILHVSLLDNSGRICMQNSASGEIPQLILEKFLDRPIEELECLFGNEESASEYKPPVKGECFYALINHACRDEIVSKALYNFGVLRRRGKIEKYAGLLSSVRPEAVLTAGIMECLSYTPNKKPFRLVHDGFREMLEKTSPCGNDNDATRMQSIIFGLSSLIPKNYLHFDQKTVQYIESLNEYWLAHCAGEENRRVPESIWNLGEIRPANSPHRRLAAFSIMMAQPFPENSILKFFYKILSANSGADADYAKKTLKTLFAFFGSLNDPYWNYRTNFGSREFGFPAALIGRQKSSTIIIDCLAPFYAAYSRNARPDLAPLADALVRNIPGQIAENSVTRFVAQRLTGGEFVLPLQSAVQAQGLIYLFNNFCCKGEKGCKECYLMKLL
ncbi:MAG: DUF2851 family protein [Planctomycetes bacterium]|nr:DUF2851 family protein [Planctomycetota bacterium]